MSLLPSPLAAALAGTGLACFAIGATRRPDPGLKLTGLAVLAFALAPVPAMPTSSSAADNAVIDCELARGELTRIALIDDGFANVSGRERLSTTSSDKRAGMDIYISVPRICRSPVSFFATARRAMSTSSPAASAARKRPSSSSAIPRSRKPRLPNGKPRLGLRTRRSA